MGEADVGVEYRGSHRVVDRSPPELTGACRSDVALKQLLDQLLMVMQGQRPGVIDGRDSERLHDFRIAVRRSRALLGQLPRVLPRRIEARYGKRLAALGALTAPLRDLDVALLKFNGYRALLPEAMQRDLEPARALIEAQQQRARQRLATALQSPAYSHFFSHWHSYLKSAVPVTTPLANARRPIKTLADERIWRLYRRVLRQGVAIIPDSPAGDLHSLRKTCKKLRYLIDAFQALYPPKRVSRVIAVLKKLQDHLGEFQDLCVHHQFFAALRQTPLPEESYSQALDELLRQIERRQHKQRRRFHACFKDFAGNRHRESFKALFKP